MNILSFKTFSIFIFLLAFLAPEKHNASYQPEEKDGMLVVLLNWKDVAFEPGGPYPPVYVEAYGFVSKYHEKKSFVLKSSHFGRHQGSLPPGVYDVFVSEGTSFPVCKRVRITEDLTTTVSLQLETDTVNTLR
ncbi:MAG TPA: hypothetical protein VJW20_16745 [Candidatus Angelobacter sp.]|nr:hypothetical protein [Candidatus Angelobacter sp.]